MKIEITCNGITHNAMIIDGVIHSECRYCDGMLAGDCEIEGG